jgi:predicted nucleic acid-binding protein
MAPELAKYEVGNVLISGKHLTIKQASFVLEQFYKIPITFVEESLISSKETFKIAVESKITFYDSSFITLALQYNATLVTDNFKHQGKFDKIKVIALAEY